MPVTDNMPATQGDSHEQFARGHPHAARCAGCAPARGAAVIIDDGERPWWDAVLIVEYPTPAAFIEMVTTKEYAEVHEHRAAALDRGDLIGTSIRSIGE